MSAININVALMLWNIILFLCRWSDNRRPVGKSLIINRRFLCRDAVWYIMKDIAIIPTLNVTKRGDVAVAEKIYDR